MAAWLSLGAALAVLNWLAAERKLRWLGYLTKPAVMLVLLAWLWQSGLVPQPLGWFWLGALFSLAGDIWLMLPRQRFAAGLGSFLLGHIAYIIGFNPSPPPLHPLGLLLVLSIAGAALLVYFRLLHRLQQAGSGKVYKIPLLVYLSVISLMGISAWLCLLRPDWPTPAALLAAGGALSFMISDSLLARDRFVRPLPHARLLVMVTYHLGQFGILVGAFLWATQ